MTKVAGKDKNGKVTPGDAGPRKVTVDPLVGVVCLASLVVFLFHGFDGVLHRDLAVYMYGGQQMLEGVPPYVSILNRAGPIAHFLPALGIAIGRAVGMDDVLAARVLYMLISCACVGAIYVLARDVFRSRVAGLVAAVALLCFYGFIEYATNGPREKTPMILFLVLALWGLTRRRWLAAGAFLSLATLVWQPAFFAGVVPAAVILATIDRRERLRSFGRFVVGGVVPAAIATAYFVVEGATSEFFEAFVSINARYTEAQPFELDYALGSIGRGYGITRFVLAIGLVAILALAVEALVRSGPRRGIRAPVIAPALAAGITFAWTLRDFNAWPDAFPLLPLAAVGVGGAVNALERRSAPVGLAVGLSFALVATLVALGYSVTQRNEELIEQRASVAYMFERLPDASVLSIGAPEPLVLSNRRNPTRHQMFGRGLKDYVNDTWPGGLKGYSRMIRETEPKLISYPYRYLAPWLKRSVESEYVRVGSVPGWKWWVHESVLARVRIPSAKHLSKGRTR